MSSYRGPKCRVERKLETLLFGRKNNILLKKNKPPGMHGVRRKKSAYKIGLESKQRCSFYYGWISQKQLINYLKSSSRARNLKKSSSGVIGAFAGALESRLDSVVRRLGFADTTGFARQLISHGSILVDGKKQTIKSFQVKPGAVISIKESVQTNVRILEARERSGKDVPVYLELKNNFEGVLSSYPDLDSIPAKTYGIVDFGQTIQHLHKYV